MFFFFFVSLVFFVFCFFFQAVDGIRDFFFFKQKTAYEISACLVGSEMCIRDRVHLIPPEFLPLYHAVLWSYAVLAAISNCYPPV